MKVILVLMVIFVLMFSSGCGWLGRTVGKAQAKIERKTGDLVDGYNEGYSNEKQKTQK